MGKLKAPLIAVEAGGKSADVNAFPHTSVVPIVLTQKDLYILFSKVVVGICSMLHYGGLVLSGRRL